MNHAIQFKTTSYPFLTVTPRKKTLKHQLLQISKGHALIKLGKNEYLIEKGQTFWVPQGCLCSISYLPNTSVNSVEFSIRLEQTFTLKAGFIKASHLLEALLDKLVGSEDEQEYTKDLLRVVMHEALDFKPTLYVSKATEKVNQWCVTQASDLPKEMQLALLVREARKQKLSGGKAETIAESLFDGSISKYQQLTEIVLGEKL